jgi:hypothetical protein
MKMHQEEKIMEEIMKIMLLSEQKLHPLLLIDQGKKKM